MIELLVVIIIIAILMALLLPVMNSVRESARRTVAHSDVVTLVTATKQYHSDYGHYPINATQMSASVWDQTDYGDPNGLYSSADLLDILRAIPDNRFNQNNQLNSRAVVYFEGRNAQSAGAPTSGIVTQNVTGPAGQTLLPGAFVDPWGDEYVVFIDDMEAGNVDQALAWFYWQNTPNVTSGVAACSLGKDHTWGTKGNAIFQGSDDIASWQ